MVDNRPHTQRVERKDAIAARCAAVMIGLVVIFQFAIVLGAPWGEYTQGGSHHGELDTAGRALAGFSLLLLGVMACALLARVGDGPMKSAPARLVTALGWVTVVYLGLAVVMNLASRSPGERIAWAPYSAVMFIIALLAMIRSRRAGEMARG